MFERIKSMIIKEFIQVFRDKRMRAVIFIAPLLQLIVFGFAVNMDIRHVSTAFYDRSNSCESRELAAMMSSSGYFDIKYYPSAPGEVNCLIDEGKVVCAVCVNDRFAEDLKAGRTAVLQVLLDGSDSNTAGIAASYIQRLLAQYASKRGQTPFLDTKKVSVPFLMPVDLRLRVWYNPDLKSSTYNVPGVMSILIMLVCLLLTAMAVVREREIGTMEQIMVTPIKPLEFILGKTLPFAAIAFFDMFLVAVVGVNVFGVPIRGHFYVLIFGVAVYILSAIGIGLFVSTIAKTQQQAMMATFIVLLPSILLSGFAFPIENMPQWIQYVTYLNPLRYFLVIIRGVFLKANGFDILWPQFFALFALGISLLTLSSFRFKKQI